MALTADATTTRPGPVRSWFPDADPHRPAAIRLVCFSYAGGTSSVYRDWPEHLGRHVQVVPVLLPGRGPRLRESPYTAMEPLAADVADALVRHGHAERCAFFGHSMGALLAYEVACRLRDRFGREPLHLFVSGSKAPHHYGTGRSHVLPDEELRQLVRDIGGLGPDDAIGGSYLDRRLPILRADLGACERYRWIPRRPLGCPVSAFSTTDDPIAPSSQVDGWRDYTAGPFLRRQLTGNHFYLTGPGRARLLQELDAELRRAADREPGPDHPVGPTVPTNGRRNPA